MIAVRIGIWGILFLSLVALAGDAWGQIYTTTGNSSDWNNPAAWTRNVGVCGVNNGGPPPPRTLNPGNACSVKIIINHPITFTGNTDFGGGFMDSLIVNTGGDLVFIGNLTVSSNSNSAGPFSFTVRGGGIFRVTGNFTNQNSGTSVRVQSGGRFNVGGNYLTAGPSSSVSVDASSFMSVTGSTTINSNHSMSVSGSLSTSNLSTGTGGAITFTGSSNITVSNILTHSNGTITLSDNVNMFVGGNLNMSGSAVLNLSGSSDLKVSGNLDLSNGTINNSGNGDIRVDGNLSMSGGGSYFGSNNSYIQVNGNHTIVSNNPVNISSDSKFVTLGNRTGSVNLSISGNACYNSSNFPNSFCLACSTGYTSNGTFYVPEGVTQITIELIGGGARGGNRTSNGRAGGGGGGAYSRITASVTPGEALAVIVGTGGNSTTANGGNSLVTRDPTLQLISSIVYAGGGGAGDDSGNGGTAGARDTRIPTSYSGGSGGNQSSTGPTQGSGGGGSAGSNSGSGNNGGVVTAGANPSGLGGPGGSGISGNSNVPGNTPPTGFGGGGGGARRASGSSPISGGIGAPGFVVISYTCPSNTACSRFLDFGTNDGFTVVEYFCSGVWNAPEGLEEFSVTSIGGGGGGGFGSSAGGGGAGAIVTQTFSNINQRPSPLITFGLPANTNFTVTVGNGGVGATSSARSINGLPSGIAGAFTNYSGAIQSISSSAPGGGGGGSSNNASFRNGLIGGSGGGGGFFSDSQVGTGGGTGSPGFANSGANGLRPNSGNTPITGGGGGGASSNGNLGSGSGNGQSFGGNGGNGLSLTVPEVSIILGGGGGGTSIGGNGGNTRGLGGSGGGGNANNSGVGVAGAVNSGSGGGAGSTGGGAGGSGRVFIYYQNFRILPVDFLSFTAVYNEPLRAGVLNWSTAREWGNSHFEVERAINEVDTWETIGKVDGAGYADQVSSYSFTDYRIPPTGGTAFYRIRQVDLDGTISHSDTRGIRVESLPSSRTWIAYPNPKDSGNFLHLELVNTLDYGDEAIFVQLSDPTAVQHQSFSVTKPAQVEEVVNQFLTGKKSGLYLLTLHWGDQQQILKLLIR